MRDEFERARKRLNISKEQFGLVSPHRHAEITQRIVESFTTLGKSGLMAWWWWEHFREPTVILRGGAPLEILGHTISMNDEHWFVAESRMPNKKGSNFWLYRAVGSAIILLLHEVHFHEYYVVDLKLRSLVCENHHGYVIHCGEPFASMNELGR